MSEQTLNSQRLANWLLSPTVKTIFLAVVVAVTFYSEQDISMSLTENFVADIEDQESWAAGGNSMRRIVFLGCAVIGMFSLLLERGKWFRVNLPMVLIATYLLWAGASITWSIDAGTTIRRYSLVLCCVIGCFGFCKLIDVKDAVLAAMLVGIGAEVAFGTFRPHLGDYRFAGTMHPNIQAAILAMGCIAAYTMARVQPKFKAAFYAVFALLFLFLILTRCRSATAAVPVSLALIWFASQPARTIVLGLVSGFWLLACACLVCVAIDFNPIMENSEVLLMGRGEETGSSLTGRLPLWQDLAEYISYRPLAGYGFKAFWNPRHIADIAMSQQWVISEAHSSYVDTALQLGIVGVLLLSTTALSIFFFSAITFRKTMQPEALPNRALTAPRRLLLFFSWHWPHILGTGTKSRPGMITISVNL